MSIRRGDDKEKISIEETQLRSQQEDLGSFHRDADGKDDLAPLGSEERAVAEKKLLRKLDYRLLPTVFIIYVMNYIDVSQFLSIRTLNYISPVMS